MAFIGQCASALWLVNKTFHSRHEFCRSSAWFDSDYERRGCVPCKMAESLDENSGKIKAADFTSSRFLNEPCMSFDYLFRSIIELFCFRKWTETRGSLWFERVGGARHGCVGGSREDRGRASSHQCLLRQERPQLRRAPMPAKRMARLDTILNCSEQANIVLNAFIATFSVTQIPQVSDSEMPARFRSFLHETDTYDAIHDCILQVSCISVSSRQCFRNVHVRWCTFMYI